MTLPLTYPVGEAAAWVYEAVREVVAAVVGVISRSLVVPETEGLVVVPVVGAGVSDGIVGMEPEWLCLCRGLYGSGDVVCVVLLSPGFAVRPSTVSLSLSLSFSLSGCSRVKLSRRLNEPPLPSKGCCTPVDAVGEEEDALDGDARGRRELNILPMTMVYDQERWKEDERCMESFMTTPKLTYSASG